MTLSEEKINTNNLKSTLEHQNQSSKIDFNEASNKRFKITQAKILNAVEPDQKDSVKESLNREIMISTLISEVLDHKPELVAQAKEEVFSQLPYIITLSQNLNGEIFKESFIASDTRNCSTQYENIESKSMSLDELFATYCIDPYFDYSGGFDKHNAVDLKVSKISEIQHFEGLETQFDNLIKTKLRRIVLDDFVNLYRATGKLSYAN